MCLLIGLVLSKTDVVRGIIVLGQLPVQKLIFHLVVLTVLDHTDVFTHAGSVMWKDIMLFAKVCSLGIESVLVNTLERIALGVEFGVHVLILRLSCSRVRVAAPGTLLKRDKLRTYASPTSLPCSNICIKIYIICWGYIIIQ